jgi:GrpB-like predicted nucleotidyltransferase (UPF0157 family)
MMNSKSVTQQLQEKYPDKKILHLPLENPTEVICEVEPTIDHPEYSKAVAVIDKSATHLHRKSTETYKIIKGELILFLNGKKKMLKIGEECEIKPYTIHSAEGNETWVEVYSTPGWTSQDHRILGKEDEIHLVPYDPLWANKFDKEKKLIEQTLGGWIVGGVHHVGSTSIPGLSAKPVIDIMVGVKSLEEAKPCIDLLATINYEYFPYRPEFMHWFCKPSMEHRTHHLYLMDPNSVEWKARLVFRDYLRSHPETKEAYEELKTTLAKKHKEDREAYTNAKTQFIEEVVEKASRI